MWDPNEARMRSGSCEVALPSFESTEEKPLLTTDGKEVPADKLKAMQDYTKLLRKKFPHMKESRVTRKVAEHFKIKLV